MHEVGGKRSKNLWASKPEMLLYFLKELFNGKMERGLLAEKLRENADDS